MMVELRPSGGCVMSLPIALQLYSVRDEMVADFEGTLRKIKGFGYDGVEFASLYGKEPQYVKDFLNELGLTPISAHVSLEEILEKKDEVFKTYKFIGCEYIVIPYLDEKRRPGGPLFEKTLEDMKEAGKKAKEHGLYLLYHNHDFEFIKIDEKYGLDIIYEKISSDYLGVQPDTCWIKVAKEDPVQYIKKYKGRVPVVHLKDFFKKDLYQEENEDQIKMYDLLGVKPKDDIRQVSQETFTFKPLGYGMQNIPEILKASKEVGAQWVVVEQDMPAKGMTAIESARLSIKYLNNIIW